MLAATAWEIQLSARAGDANRVAQLDAFGLQRLRVVERPLRPLRDHEIRIRVRAVALNCRGPLVTLSDCAGEVQEFGSAVDRFQIGDRVTAAQMPAWTTGAFKAEFSGDQRGFVKVPDSLSFAEAATFPTAALTAWNALFELDNLKPGRTVLVQGCGGVSIFALQFALAAGARVFMITGSATKIERLKGLGAAHVICCRQEPEWSRAVLEITGGGGVDHIIETFGAGTISESIRAAAIGGSISVVGFPPASGERLDVLRILAKNLRVQGVVVGSVEMLERMIGMIEKLGIRPIIDHAFEFEQADKALEYVSSGRQVGNVIIKV
jgi:NADPH:quinone reductase-like Zn-dependent oxidoreductase